MTNYDLKMKSITRFFLMWGICIYSFSFTQAQNSLKEEYLRQAGDYAFIYSGELEIGYNPYFHLNFPYYNSPDYVEGDIIFNSNLYSKQLLRLDLYKDNLVILLPEKSYGKIINPEKMNLVRIYDKEFIYCSEGFINGLKKGYYLLLHKGENITVLRRDNYKLNRSFSTNQESFSYHTNYYLLVGEKYYSVKNQQAFYRIFPQYKEQLKKVIKEKSLNFKTNKEHSLSVLADHCDLWIINEGRP